jgi:Fe2+ or Zn2+ uptake regulation protein
MAKELNECKHKNFTGHIICGDCHKVIEIDEDFISQAEQRAVENWLHKLSSVTKNFIEATATIGEESFKIRIERLRKLQGLENNLEGGKV